MFAEDGATSSGELLATASQSVIVRFWKGDRPQDKVERLAEHIVSAGGEVVEQPPR